LRAYLNHFVLFDFFFHGYPHHRDLHSFPTRRSSDLLASTGVPCPRSLRDRRRSRTASIHREHSVVARATFAYPVARPNTVRVCRSEEHTSELQSPCNLVCRLLLEKKKKKIQQPHTRR